MSVFTFLKSDTYAANANIGGTIQILDNFDVAENIGQAEYGIHEISGLAFDKDENLLYAVADEGVLFKLKLNIVDRKISTVAFVSAFPLSLKGKRRPYSDTEDLTLLKSNNGILGDTEIAVVFEDGPVAGLFNLKGDLLKDMTLPIPLNDPRIYPDKNSTIEAMSYIQDHGFIYVPQTTTTESKSAHHVYADDGTIWSYNYVERKHNNTSSMLTNQNNTIMILEGSEPKGLWSKLTLSGHETHIREIDLRSCNTQNECSTIDYIPQDPGQLTDRYEGFTQIAENTFLLATDQTAGTRFTLFEMIRKQ